MSERGSTHHSARVDDELQKETQSLVRGSPAESRVQEWRRAEPPADGEPLPDAHTTLDDIELRSLIATSLRPSAFPGDRARLLAVAEEEHADARILGLLRALPATRTYVNLEAVWEALGGTPETRVHAPPAPREVAPGTGPSATEPAPVGREHSRAPAVAQVPAPASAPAPAPASVPAPTPASVVAQLEHAGSSVVSRLFGLARAGLEVGVGVAIYAVQRVRQRV
jgi:hypothetical protein